MTDDQDARLGSVDYMPNVQKLLVQQGTSYLNHYVTSAVCITHVYPPYGGYSRYAELGLGKQTLPVWLQQAGYSTNYVGKLMNDIHLHNYNTPAPQGFDYQEQLLDPYTYVYDVAVLSKNGERPVVYKHYQTDVLHAKALNVLRRQRDASKPFFLMVAPMAPHGQVRLDIYDKDIAITEPPTPAARHAHLFKDAKVPRMPNFNPETPTRTANFWKFLPHANETRVKTFDDVHRARLQSLQAVDEMVASLVAELEHQGKLENTYIFYTSDNGYHIGQHRAYPGKSASIEEDINVPFIVRGPGIAHGETSRLLSAHHDLAPTFLALAKGSRFVPAGIDGGVIPLTDELRQQPKQAAKEAFAVEFWFDLQRPEGGLVWTEPYEGVNTYKSVRVISEKHNCKQNQ
ncbi:alkaline-phosphatase-like protein [Gongronella butleri]|nr:alkaline-phosphatase-like protein [Gongronella butleri]